MLDKKNDFVVCVDGTGGVGLVRASRYFWCDGDEVVLISSPAVVYSLWAVMWRVFSYGFVPL